MGLVIKTTGLEQYAPGGEARIKILTIGGPGVGKAAASTTPVATPYGWKRIGDLKVGDFVIGSDGKPTEVQGVYPQGVRPAYVVTLNDGATAVVDGEHLWTVQSRKLREQNKPPITLTTQEMIDRGLTRQREGRKDGPQFFLPLVQPIQFADRFIGPNVSPYLLGTLLANGSFTTGTVGFATNDVEVAERCIRENPHLDIAECTYPSSTSRRWRITRFHSKLDDLNLDQVKSGDKFVPHGYLIADEATRRDLLAGLMDGDGSVQPRHRARFHTTSPALARDVQQLVWGLGGVARIDVSDRTHDGKPVEYYVSIWLPENPFGLARKAKDYDCDPWFRGFVAAEEVDPVEMVCIKVAADDELFVIENSILTHNTRWASFFPKPIYADCEDGLASVADRKVPYVAINSSEQMLDLLTFLKQECRQPQENRRFQTVIIDTLDAFQRKVKNEWMEANKKEFFSGWEAWGYLNSKMQLLMTRLLNLDLNVIVNVHYKDKTTKDDETGKETHQLMLQLQGESSDTAFNDFDLVGWMGTYWESEGGERVQKRGLTFKPTPDKPFLKDRLHVTPNWLEVTFAPSDYAALFERVQAKVADIEASETVGEIPSATSEPSNFVVPPGAAGSGALPPSAPRDIPFSQLDKPGLLKKARELGVTTTVDGAPIRANTTKAELVAALESQKKDDPPAPPVQPPVPRVEQKAPEPQPRPLKVPAQRGAPALESVPEGTVNTATGELVDEPAPAKEAPEPTHEQAVEIVQNSLGGTVIEDKVLPVQPDPPTEKPVQVCADCGKDLAGEKPDFVKLAWIKFRARLCEDDYQKRKTSR